MAENCDHAQTFLEVILNRVHRVMIGALKYLWGHHVQGPTSLGIAWNNLNLQGKHCIQFYPISWRGWRDEAYVDPLRQCSGSP